MAFVGMLTTTAILTSFTSSLTNPLIVQGFGINSNINKLSIYPHISMNHIIQRTTITSTTQLRMAASSSQPKSLKPAAIPLMESGKYIATSGERFIEISAGLGLYGGALSASGASMRNGGDRIAQAGSSCRFKTGVELVVDELREGASCLDESANKLRLAAKEGYTDGLDDLACRIEEIIEPMSLAGTALEEAGAGVMKRIPLSKIGQALIRCSDSLTRAAEAIKEVAPSDSSTARKEVVDCHKMMVLGSTKMKEAGESLSGPRSSDSNPKGKAWIKGQ